MIKSNQKIAIAAIVLSFLYVLSIIIAYDKYLVNRNIDPMAMFHSLFPIFYFVTALFSALCIIYVFYDFGNKYIHIIFLIQLSIMLWFTPYCLSGFSRTTDSLWHVGIAKNLPEIGSEALFSWYYHDYPGSYIFNFIMMTVSGIDAITYARLIYPFFCTVGIVLLWYVFVFKFFAHKIAFISTLIAIWGLAPEIHVSPHSLGTLLVFVSLIILFTFENRKCRIMGLMSIFTLIIVHPISPLILLIFMIASYVVKVFNGSARTKLPNLGFAFFTSLFAWFGWAIFRSTQTGITIAESIYNTLTLNFSHGIEAYTAISVAPEIFQFSLIARVVSYTYFAVPLIFFLTAIVALDLRKGIMSVLQQIGEKIHFKEMLMLSTALLCATLAVSSIFSGAEVAGRSFYLWERAFSYYIFSASAYIGSNVLIKIIYPSHKTWTHAKVLILAWFVFLSLTYPLMVRAERESFQIYPPSENSGFMFLQSRFSLSEKTISVFLPNQLASYIDPEKHFNYHDSAYRIQFLSEFPLDSGSRFPDVMAFRRTEYFYVSYQYDKDLENNRYTRALAWIQNTSDFDKIYTSLTFEIYSKAITSLPE